MGPYRFLGERVVSACVKGGASHIDISGEEQFIASMHLKYDDLAKESGVFVISACGFDSIPNDLGHVVLAQSMEGDVNSVESFIKVLSNLKPKVVHGDHSPITLSMPCAW